MKSKENINWYRWVYNNIHTPEDIAESAMLVIMDALSLCHTKRELSIAVWAASDSYETPKEIEEMLDEAVEETALDTAKEDDFCKNPKTLYESAGEQK